MTPCEPAPLVAAEAARSEGAGEDCLLFDLVAAGRAFATLPDTGLSRSVALQHARVALGARTAEDVQLRAAVVATRSGGDTGYVGVAGEAYVPVVEIAEARWDWRDGGWAVAAGLVDDLWVGAIEEAWARRDVARGLAADQGWMDRADAGGWLSWTAPERLATLSVALTTGEGHLRRERNDGVDLTAVVRVRPLEEGEVRLEGLAMVREGSRGLGQAPDHRVGAAVVLRHDRVAIGLDGLAGLGLAGDGTLRPAGVSLWARTGEDVPAVGWVRGDVGRDQLAATDANEIAWHVGGGPRLPLRGPLYVAAGWEGRRYGPDAAPVAGGEALAAVDVVFVQVGAELSSAP